MTYSVRRNEYICCFFSVRTGGTNDSTDFGCSDLSGDVSSHHYGQDRAPHCDFAVCLCNLCPGFRTGNAQYERNNGNTECPEHFYRGFLV